jgi:hypothetical protein
MELNSGSYNYGVVFEFSKNEYFENEAIAVRLKVDSTFECSEIFSDEIKWREGKCLAYKLVTKWQTNKKTLEKRSVEKKLPQLSFFRIFEDRSIKDEEELEEEELPEEGDDEELFFTDVISEAMYEFFAVAKYHSASFYGADIPDYQEGMR